MPGLKYPIPHIPMLGKGSILLDIFDAAGLPTGLRHLGNCTKFELDLKDDIAELYQSLNKSVTLIATALKKRQPKIAITGTDFSSDHMAIVQMSSGKTTVATTAATITDEVLISATVTGAKGRFFQTAKRNIDMATANVPVLTQTQAGSPVTLTTPGDYVVADPVGGMIYIPRGARSSIPRPSRSPITRSWDRTITSPARPFPSNRATSFSIRIRSTARRSASISGASTSTRTGTSVSSRMTTGTGPSTGTSSTIPRITRRRRSTITRSSKNGDPTGSRFLGGRGGLVRIASSPFSVEVSGR